jgi:hypothetical protein
MPTPSNFSLYSYAVGGAYGPVLREYSQEIEQLEFTTTAPGGYGGLKCRVRTSDPSILRGDVQIFNNVALVQGFTPIWLGRWDEPALALDNSDSDLYELAALGAGDCLKDDSQDAAYTASTAYQIIQDQLQGSTLGRAAWLPIDSDLSLVMPDRPSTTYNYAPNAKNIEDVLNEVLAMQGDYTWGVWAHPIHRDAFDLPTWQLQAHIRNTTTVNYQITLADEIEYAIRPTNEYSYNCVTVKYKDPTTTFPASVTVQDSRLNANKSQGKAPFPFRRLIKDYSSYNISATQATVIANALLASYQNGGFKITIKVAAARDSNGNEIPLWQVQADHNVFIPQLTPHGAQLNLVPTPNVNLFYITETNYQEQADQVATLELSADNFFDRAAFQVARLQYQEDQRRKAVTRTHGHHQAVGEPEKGTVATSWPGVAVTTDSYEEGVNFKTTMVNVPTSITLTAASSSNAATPTTTNITQTGFSFTVHPAANGAGYWRGSYTTNGN